MKRQHFAIIAVAGTLALSACSTDTTNTNTSQATTSSEIDHEKLAAELETTTVSDGRNFDSVDDLLTEAGLECSEKHEYIEPDVHIFKETSTCTTDAGFVGIEIYHDNYSRSAGARAFNEGQFAESKLDADDPDRITEPGTQRPYLEEGNWIVRCWDDAACEPWVKALGIEPQLSRSS